MRGEANSDCEAPSDSSSDGALVQTWPLEPIKLHGVSREGRDTVDLHFREAIFNVKH